MPATELPGGPCQRGAHPGVHLLVGSAARVVVVHNFSFAAPRLRWWDSRSSHVLKLFSPRSRDNDPRDTSGSLFARSLSINSIENYRLFPGVRSSERCGATKRQYLFREIPISASTCKLVRWVGAWSLELRLTAWLLLLLYIERMTHSLSSTLITDVESIILHRLLPDREISFLDTKSDFILIEIMAQDPE